MTNRPADSGLPALTSRESEEGDASQDEMFAELTHQQTHALLALMSEASIERAAGRARVSPRTLHRWLRQPTFQRAYRIARRQAFQQAIGLIVKYAPVAVSTLVKTLTDPTAPHHSKVAAAGLILRFGRDGIELDDIATRIDVIESMVTARSSTLHPRNRSTDGSFR